jgi:hypothetical protein
VLNVGNDNLAEGNGNLAKGEGVDLGWIKIPSHMRLPTKDCNL